MQIEYEATFKNIDKDEIRKKLKEVGALLKRPEFLQKRCTFNLPNEKDIKNSWLRVRDEGDKISLTLKTVDGDKIENQKEIELKIDSFDKAVLFLTAIGCNKKSYQETKRELWKLDGVEIMIDEWPYLEPFIEVEGNSEEDVKNVGEKLGFNYNDALFCCVTKLYKDKYNIAEDIINNKTPEIIFEGKNPFI